jgi:nicotinamide phosphoribosyltransferase
MKKVIETRKRTVTKTVTDELNGIRGLLAKYPTGILSMVSDTFDLWRMCTEYLPILKEEILARDGKLVIRPDSGNPVDIICGAYNTISSGDEKNLDHNYPKYGIEEGSPEYKGVIELLWDVFGGTVNEQGYKVLDPHIGAIYGDSITIDRAEEICKRLEAKGFASTNIVLGVGSFTYQFNTRDTFGFAMKATYVEVNFEGREIFKDPITDDGMKKSATGLLYVGKGDVNGELKLFDKVTWETEAKGQLTTLYLDGKFEMTTSLTDIKNRLK